MLRTFRGEFAQKIDGKGRVSIPASFRRVLESCDPEFSPGDNQSNLIIVYGDTARSFLEGYSVEAMTRIDERIRAMKNGPRKTYMTKFFNTLSWETTVDQTGRLVLPKKLRDKIGLTEASEAVFAGTNETFQIWHPDDYEALQAESDAAAFEGLEPGADPTMMLDMED